MKISCTSRLRQRAARLLAATALVTSLSGVQAAPASAATTHPLLVLGDSVPAGGGCECAPFARTYAQLLAARTGTRVPVYNHANNGDTSDETLARLRDVGVRRAVRRAPSVVVMVGANDYALAFSRVLRGDCDVTCFRAAGDTVRTNVTALVEQLQNLHRGPLDVIVVGYWNVVLDGDVGLARYGAAGMQLAHEATFYANRVLLGVARSTGATYVSTRVALRGADGLQDPTPYLASDGDHPNERGHQLIGRAVYAAAPEG